MRALQAAAVYQAKMALRSEGHPVRDWAGWVLTGDPDQGEERGRWMRASGGQGGLRAPRSATIAAVREPVLSTAKKYVGKFLLTLASALVASTAGVVGLTYLSVDLPFAELFSTTYAGHVFGFRAYCLGT